MTDMPPDLLTRRVNDISTTLLDVLGVLLFAGAAGYAGWTFVDPWAGLMAAGVVVTVLSSIAQHRASPRKASDAEVVTDTELPGPTDAGHLHVMGR